MFVFLLERRVVVEEKGVRIRRHLETKMLTRMILLRMALILIVTLILIRMIRMIFYEDGSHYDDDDEDVFLGMILILRMMIRLIFSVE